MSANDAPTGREVAYRLFAAEFDDADFSYSESDEERAPNYVVTPTGARVNRLFVVGVLTEVERVGEDVLRARVVDPTGAFVVYAGQYQPDAMAFLDDVSTPAFVAVTGKARTFQPEDSDRVYTSIRPESVSEVDAEARDRWVVRTAEQTLERVATAADALARPERGDGLREALAAGGVPEGLAAGLPRAFERYDTTGAYLAAVRELALDAVRVVTGDREEVEGLALAPDAGGETDRDLSFGGAGGRAAAGGEATTDTVETSDAADAASAGTTAPTTDPDRDADTVDTDTAAEPKTDPDRDAETVTADTATEPKTDPEPEPDDESEAEADEAFDLDAEEREAVVEEHGVEFSTADEVPDAGESDIETPDPEGVAVESETEAGTGARGADEEATADDADADLEDAVVEVMTDVNDGDGVSRSELVATVTEEYGASEAAVEEAIQGALMAGRCYESGEDELTPI